jgi:hypothetical protein
MKRKRFDKKDYVPLEEREDFDERKVRKLKPHKNYRYQGTHFDTVRPGARRRDG